MKQVNFSHSGGFPLEQETLERLQTAYRSELYEALKGHLSIKTDTNYIIAPATSETKGWAIIHQLEKDPAGTLKTEGILYPIQIGTVTEYLKTTRTGTNLIYGTGTSETAYFDYEAKYISPIEFNNAVGVAQNNDALTVYYYDLKKFKIVKDIDGILKTIDDKIAVLKTTLENNIGNVKTTLENSIGSVKTNLESSIGSVKTTLENNIGNVKINLESSIGSVKDSCLHINGDNAMLADLDLGNHLLSKLDIKDTFDVANVRASDFRLGSKNRRGLRYPTDYLGRALVDASTQSSTNLTLNYDSDWDNTYIGGKVYLNNVNTTGSNASLLVIDNLNQVVKSNTLIDSLLNRITALENRPAQTSPILYKGFKTIKDLAYDVIIPVEFPSLSTSNYMVLGGLKSKGANWNDDNDLIWTWGNPYTFKFELYIREVAGNYQNVEFHYAIIAL